VLSRAPGLPRPSEPLCAREAVFLHAGVGTPRLSLVIANHGSSEDASSKPSSSEIEGDEDQAPVAFSRSRRSR